MFVCENNQKWPKTKHCFDSFDTSDTFDSSDWNQKFWQIFSNEGDRGQFTVGNLGCAIKLIEFCNIAFLMRSFKDKIISNKQVDYNSDWLSNLGRSAAIFLIHRLLNFWPQHFQNIELLNSILSNTSDDGDNDEKTKNLITRVGMFKNMGGNIPGGNFLGRNFPGGNFPGGSLMGGNFPGGSFPDTAMS